MTEQSTEMPFLQHLGELRVRLIRIVSGVTIGFIFAFTWSEEILRLLTEPIRTSFENFQLIGTGPTEAFVTKLHVAAVAGVILTIPWTFYQIWLFIAPGLHSHERRLALPFVAVSSTFFLLGVYFCYAVVLPFAFKFFSDEFASIALIPQIRVSEYLSFVVRLVLVFGIMFEMPVLAFVLARLGLVSSMWLLKQFRFALVLIFVVAGVLTPPDVITQTLLALPLCLLYGLCVAVCRYVEANPSSSNSSSSS